MLKGVYQPRNPRATGFYQCLSHHCEEFESSMSSPSRKSFASISERIADYSLTKSPRSPLYQRGVRGDFDMI